MHEIFPLKLIFIYIFDLFRLHTEVVQRLPLRGVVEANHQPGQIDAESDPLMVSPCFPQRMAAIVAFEIDGRCHVAIFRCKKEKECMKDALNLLKNKDVAKVFCDDTG